MDVKKFGATVERINKKYGAGTIFLLGSKYQSSQLPKKPTGIAALDEVIGGGLPEGRLIEILGRESAGKTSLLYHIMGQYKARLFVNMEGTFDPERAAVFGNVVGKGAFFLSRPYWGEACWDIVEGAAESGIPLIGIDSVPAMIPKAVYEEKNIDHNARLGAVAKLMSERLPVLAAKAEKSGSTVVFVNQLRDTIGAMPFAEQTHTPGGRALKHWLSLRLEVAHRGFITKKNQKVGIISRVLVKKSKVGNPGGICELELIWGTGFKNA